MQSNALIKNTCLFHKLLKTEQHASKVAEERAEPEKKTRHSNWPWCDTQTSSFCSIHGEIFHCRRKVLAGCAKPTLLARHPRESECPWQNPWCPISGRHHFFGQKCSHADYSTILVQNPLYNISAKQTCSHDGTVASYIVQMPS